MGNDFVSWLIQQLEARGWTNSELARRAGVVPSTVSMVISEQKRPGLELCLGIARAFGERPEKVLRLAKLLPPLPPTVEEEGEAIAIFRALPASTRATILQMLRGLNTTQPVRIVTEPPSQYAVKPLNDEIAALVKAHPRLGPLFDEAQTKLSEYAIRALVVNVQIWIHETQRRENFTELHTRLSNFLSSMQASSPP